MRTTACMHVKFLVYIRLYLFLVLIVVHVFVVRGRFIAIFAAVHLLQYVHGSAYFGRESETTVH